MPLLLMACMLPGMIPNSAPVQAAPPVELPSATPIPEATQPPADPLAACFSDSTAWIADSENKREITLDDGSTITIEYDGKNAVYIITNHNGFVRVGSYPVDPGAWEFTISVYAPGDNNDLVVVNQTIEVVGICNGHMYKSNDLPPLEGPMPDTLG